MAANDKQGDDFQQAENAPQLESGKAAADLAFLDIGQNGTVDLDALFDALNIVADNGGGGMEFIAAGDTGGGTLIISGAELTLGAAPAPLEDLAHSVTDLLKSSMVSDES